MVRFSSANVSRHRVGSDDYPFEKHRKSDFGARHWLSVSRTEATHEAVGSNHIRKRTAFLHLLGCVLR